MAKRIYMGGICGMGMAPLALFLKADGADVRGFDEGADPRVKDMLEKAGIGVQSAFDPQDLSDADDFVISTALYRRKEEFGARSVFRRGEYLAQICKTRRLAAVAGSHGKSSVSAMLAHCANKYAADCGWLVGALPCAFAPARHCAQGALLISEIDESDGTIENFEPEITIALNADLDHTDRYADASHIERMFLRLFSRTKKKLLILKGDEILLRAARASGKDFLEVEKRGEFISTNEAFARLAWSELFNSELPEDALDDFGGVVRRQEVLKSSPSFTAIADYAHHPAELEAFLRWLSRRRGERKIVFFQPHRHTRTKFFAREFARILAQADCAEAFLLNVYPASEPFDAEATSKEIAKHSEKLKLLETDEEFKSALAQARASDEKVCVALVGAGDIYFKAKEFLK